MSKFVPFKAGNATFGLSSDKELLKNINSPLLGTLKGSLVNCLENNQCKDLEEAVNLLSNLEYEQASHPVHILDADGNLSPSAFIPFCAWAGDMGSLGTKAPNFSIPVCNAFQPRDLNGHICYSLNLTTEKLQKPGQGVQDGLTLVIDYNRERSLAWPIEQNLQRSEGLAALTDHTSKEPELHLYMDTLQPFYGRGPGSYSLSSLKQVTTSKNFDTMDASVRRCQFQQNWAQCKSEANRKQANASCGCIPAGLHFHRDLDQPLCLPRGVSCYQGISGTSEECTIPCHGLYSDVTKDKTSHIISKETPGMEKAMTEYIAYKAGKRRDPVAHLKGWEADNTLHMVTIFINSPTFDLMTKDSKTTFMDQLAVIGGTLGLFAGFSIISGIEVIYFLVKAVFGIFEVPKKSKEASEAKKQTGK